MRIAIEEGETIDVWITVSDQVFSLWEEWPILINEKDKCTYSSLLDAGFTPRLKAHFLSS